MSEVGVVCHYIASAQVYQPSSSLSPSLSYVRAPSGGLDGFQAIRAASGAVIGFWRSGKGR